MGAPAFDLLRYLDEVVAADTGAPGFRARVCVGVKGRGFWLATFDGARATTVTTEAMPADFDVAVGFRDDDEVRALLEPASDVPGLITGDRALFVKFVQRYLRARSPLATRLAR